MTRLANTAEGGTDGVTVTSGNSGGSSGDAFSGVTIGTGAALTFSATHPAHGSLGYHAVTSGTAAQAYAQHTMAAASNQLWARTYLYFTAFPTTTVPVIRWVTTGGAALCGYIAVNTSGTIIVANSAGSTVGTMTGVVIPLNQIIRVEGYLVGNASTGQIEAKLFDTAESSIPDGTITTAVTVNTSGQPQIVRWGVSATLASCDYYFDTVAVDDNGYIGAFAPIVTSWSYGYSVQIG